jgi:phage uncharacterized protein, XkdX family
MSNFAKKVKKFYDEGLWSKSRVHDAVEKGKITEAEYEEIVGEPYVA